ncbi:hypothetical protein J7I93_03745 [Bacillus sp. ISL-47]|uniref:hypothetical protein n=1 Tax=Bacillus sp. ISL-47 TaxID=2819130 RepID=UPI001BE80F11|nr:hypothetical protein [Bacillus sp. ISL-47]MBT2687290.1 hypothetical protein [Bacillus sp. ISL-47]MBT2706640.1 hypothetical protein [Pseudomonas sp. ISL-84]
MNEGYVKLYRKLTSNAVWQDPWKLRLWLLCLMKASYKEREIMIDNQLVNLEAGQFVTGRDSLENEFNRDMQKKYQVSGRTLWRWLKLFESNNYISIHSTNKFSIITINKWSMYNKIDQQLSEIRPEVDQRLSTNKKEKKLKKGNKPSKSYKNEAILDVLIKKRSLGSEK